MIIEPLVYGLTALVAGLGHTSLIESVCHNFFQHASRRVRDVYEDYPTLSSPLLHSWESHTMAHHVLTFRGSQTVQHRSLESEVEAVIYALEHGMDVSEHLGLTVNFWGFCKMLLPFSPLCAAAIYLAPLEYALPFSATAFLCPANSKWVHPYLHLPYEVACREAKGISGWYIRSIFGRFMWVYHDMHHRKPSINYNLVGVLGDILTRRFKWPTPQDWAIAERRNGPRLRPRPEP